MSYFSFDHAHTTFFLPPGDQRGHTAQALWTRRRGQSIQPSYFETNFAFIVTFFTGSDFRFWLLGGTIDRRWTQRRL
jgi:hypothetical protein